MRTRLDSIFVPIDESKFAQESVKLAKSLNPDALTLFHAIEPWPAHVSRVLFPYAGMGEDAPDVQHDVVKSVRSAFAKRFQIEKDRSIDLKIEYGRNDVIEEQLRGSEADLVVLGAHGGSAALFDAVGATATHVVRTSKKPVLLVRDQPSVSKMIICVDLSAKSSEVIETAIVLASHVGAEAELLCVVPEANRDVREALQIGPNENPKKTIGRVRERVGALLERATKEIDLKFGEHEIASKIEKRTILYGPTVETILAHVRQTDADLIAFGARRDDHNYIGSTAWSLLRRAPTNCLVVP